MNSLHEVVYQIVSNPLFLADFIKSPQEFTGKFALSNAEAQALVAISTDNNTLQRLLSVETLKSTAQSILENVWVPPTFP